MMDLLTVVLVTLAFALVLLCSFLTTNRGHLETLGIPVVKPFLCFGSPPFDFHNYNMQKKYIEDVKKYGKTYGLYRGRTPTIRTIDPEIVKSVTIKNFDSFSDVITMPVPARHYTLNIAGGEIWHQLRKNLSPTFTSGKLRGMMDPMTDVADKMMEHLDALVKRDPVINVKEVFQAVTLNTIARCAFGIDANAHSDQDDDSIIKAGREAFGKLICRGWIQSLFFNVIQHFSFVLKFMNIFPAAFDKLRAITKETMAYRKAKKIESNDFINTLMELTELKEKNDPSVSALSQDLIAVQGVIFFVAGFETTSNNLSTFVYNMAKNPEIQEKVHDDIRKSVDGNFGLINLDTINNMEYLDAAISENLRLNGPVLIRMRSCTKDCEIAPGLLVRKGMWVEMPIDASHHCPEFFPDPYAFKPERFLKENVDKIIPYTYRPFGSGPRTCIGQRFTLVETKIVLAKLLLKYKVMGTPRTKMDLVKGDQFLLTYPEMIVKLEPRE